jgi:aquaporin Z
MLLAAELYLHHRGIKKVYCAKLHHNNHQRCIFKCRYDEISKKKEK